MNLFTIYIYSSDSNALDLLYNDVIFFQTFDVKLNLLL